MSRVCFTQLMQFDTAGQIIVPVRFYFAQPGARVFDGPHLFGVDYFLPGGPVGLGPGLYWNSDWTFDAGVAPPGVDGTHDVCSPLDWWINGVPSDAPPLALDAFGRPICCQPANSVVQSFGVQVGLQLTACQPWHVFGPPVRQLRDLTAGVTWTQTASLPGSWSGHDPGAAAHHTTITHSGQPCAAFDATLPIIINFGGIIPPATCQLASFDPATNIGLWQVPLTAFAYAGHLFSWLNPV